MISPGPGTPIAIEHAMPINMSSCHAPYLSCSPPPGPLHCSVSLQVVAMLAAVFSRCPVLLVHRKDSGNKSLLLIFCWSVLLVAIFINDFMLGNRRFFQLVPFEFPGVEVCRFVSYV